MRRPGSHPDLAKDALASLFDEGVRVASGPIDGEARDLLPEERAQIARAIPWRRREFATGRKLARRALARAGFEHALLLAGEDRAPIWPAGAVGTIAHCTNLCVAAAARAGDARSLGVDVEPFQGLDPELWESVLVATERAWLAAEPGSHRGHLARMVFVAKEAYFKAQYPLTGMLLDFHDVAVKVSVRRERFTARCLKMESGRPLLRALEGRLCAAGEWLFAGVTVRG